MIYCTKRKIVLNLKIKYIALWYSLYQNVFLKYTPGLTSGSLCWQAGRPLQRRGRAWDNPLVWTTTTVPPTYLQDTFFWIIRTAAGTDQFTTYTTTFLQAFLRSKRPVANIGLKLLLCTVFKGWPDRSQIFKTIRKETMQCVALRCSICKWQWKHSLTKENSPVITNLIS